ncbi:MAG TPA: FAD-binding protein [Actinobacteria bacterium]|nr:FAD-binding protein [Actinomycetota bacterium]
MESDSLIILVGGLTITALAMLPFYLRHQYRERRARRSAEEAKRYGLDVAATLHPIVHPGACISAGACLSVCPEGDVLGLVQGMAVPVAPGRCIGHGLCERACPVEAIQLVFGTATRGVELPRIKGNFETNVTGLYVIGELGGMGLIRNAFEQGRQCVEGIISEGGRSNNGMDDVIVVGAGPAGLSASLNCLHHGLKCRTIEREDIGGTVRSYPRKKLVLTQPVTVPGYGKLKVQEIRKEALMGLWTEIIETTGLEVQTEETVTAIERGDTGFTVRTSKQDYYAKRVILAIGRRGVPRKLGVPGEDQPKVAYSLREPEAYAGDRVLVVGGGDSAVEAALSLAEIPGTSVTLSYRKDRFTRIKPKNHERSQAAEQDGSVRFLWSTSVTDIRADQVTYRDADGQDHVLPNDQVFIFAGGELPTKFLQAAGVMIDTKFGET